MRRRENKDRQKQTGSSHVRRQTAFLTFNFEALSKVVSIFREEAPRKHTFSQMGEHPAAQHSSPHSPHSPKNTAASLCSLEEKQSSHNAHPFQMK